MRITDARKLKGTPAWHTVPYRFRRGIDAEDSFKEYAEKLGWIVTEPTIKEDTEDHIDWFITKGKKKYSVDVKSTKRITRGCLPSSTHTWIECHGNCLRAQGWLFEGKEDLVAFETTPNNFILRNRKDMSGIVHRIYNEKLAQYKITKNVRTAANAGYIYNRKAFEHIMWLSHETTKKSEVKIGA